MRHVKQLAVTVVAILALSGLAASAAQATEPILNGSFPIKVEASGSLGFLKAGSGTANVIECEKNTATGEITSPGNLGKVKITWTGCTSGGVKCKSEEGTGTDGKKGASGEIVIEIPVHIVLLNSGPNMTEKQLYYFYFLVLAIRIKCGVLEIVVKGDPAPNGEETLGGILCLITNEEGVKTGKATLECKAVSEKQEVTSCEEPAELCTAEAIELLSEFVAGEPLSSVLEQTDSVTFSPEVTAEN